MSTRTGQWFYADDIDTNTRVACRKLIYTGHDWRETHEYQIIDAQGAKSLRTEIVAKKSLRAVRDAAGLVYCPDQIGLDEALSRAPWATPVTSLSERIASGAASFKASTPTAPRPAAKREGLGYSLFCDNCGCKQIVTKEHEPARRSADPTVTYTLKCGHRVV